MTAMIKVRNLSLDVPIFLQPERSARSWKSMLLGAAFDPPRRRMTRLLDDINFEVSDGDRLAILGRNGAGKSTLLRVLNRVYQPSAGDLTVQGSCQALLNMSLGFNGEATVSENIFLRGVAMGLKSSFLRTQVEPILEFSGLQAKASHRLRTLSSGQKMRLGFAISTSVQHDIILMDEWVGAGDADFMAKAKERMRSRVGGSKIVVLASHSVGLLRDMCNKGIVLEQGCLMYAGDIMGSLKYYHDMMARFRELGAEGLLKDNSKQSLIEPATAAVYGYAERIELVAGRIRIHGWMVDNDGAVPSGLSLDVSGVHYRPLSLARRHRADVARHLGLGGQTCGFTAEFKVEHIDELAQLRGDMRVLAGDDVRPDMPLQLAAAVALAIGNNR